MEEERYRVLRERMVDQQIRLEVRDARVLAAMRAVPRHRFVPECERAFAYDNRPLPLACGQTISQPLMVALMLEAARLEGPERVLEVGAGSGYQAAVLGRLAARVVAVERLPELAESAAAALRDVGIGNVEVVTGDGSLGWPPGAPYDRILVAAGGHEVPDALVEQLAPGGVLVIPVGGRTEQTLTVVTKGADGSVLVRNHGPCAFVPLIGAAGWPDASV
ncbi:MAG TPA: protein-L-isoaspartate(D-aspartate) O-methyltransferase [Chthonomonadaceae bacterium]|nr:protein-L-isoaspartate(D-aspartate) O-methyltransferase [Chthonomonadaceae bacterium]